MIDLIRIWFTLAAAAIRVLPLAIGLVWNASVPLQVVKADEQHSIDPASQSSAEFVPRRLDSMNLPNLIQLNSKVLSGGQPAGDAGFEELATRGVKTIISVDGATPDVAQAKRFGIRYVHLPHGYDGINKERSLELAKAVRDLEGPIYVHCHHGKHRSPAAAAVACVSAGLLTPDRAIGVLELAGTNPNYRGLFQTVRRTTPLDPVQLDRLEVEFREVAAVTPMATAMLSLEKTLDQLQQVDAVGQAGQHGGSTASDSGGGNLHEQAILLREHFTELIRSENDSLHPDGFMRGLKDSEQAAAALTKLLDDQAGDAELTQPARELIERITANCASCHSAFRDSPAD